MVSRASLVTLQMTAISEGKQETGIFLNISPHSKSKGNALRYHKRNNQNLPIMLTTIKPCIFSVVMMIGSSEYGDITSAPWKSPERSWTTAGAKKGASCTPTNVNNPSSVTAMH